MPRRVSGHQIKGNRAYTVEELAEALGVSQQTVRQWIKRGLNVLDERRPLLILGADAKTFLANRMSDQRCTLKFGEAYCTKCRAARALEPISVIARLLDLSERRGPATEPRGRDTEG